MPRFQYVLILAVACLSVSCRGGSTDGIAPNAFADGLVAFVGNVDDPAWPRDAVTVDSAAASGDTLHLMVRYGGGCRTHRFALLLGNAFMESHPVQVHVRLAHDADGDMCRALLSRSLSFDLTPLKAAYRASYGPGAATIVMNLVGQGRSIRYTFE